MSDDNAVTAEQWLAAFGARLGVQPPSADDVERLLDLAGVAAHASERKAAPIACWMVATAGLDPQAALELSRTITPTTES